MADADDEPRRSASFLNEVNARLDEAAKTGAPLELILAVQGRVGPVAGKHGRRWRLRTGRGHVFTFRPEFVIAFNGTGRARRAIPTPSRRTVSVDPSQPSTEGPDTRPDH